MNLKKIILSAALLGGVLSTAAFATTADAHQRVTQAVAIEAPVVTRVVSPTGLSRYLSPNVTLSLMVDENGRPHDIRILRGDRALAGNLLAAVSQWEFKPAKKNGVAVPTRIELPLQLVEASS